MKRFPVTAEPPTAPLPQYANVPHWAPDLTSTVKVPLAQAFISALPAGVLTCAGLLLALFLLPAPDGEYWLRALAALIGSGMVYLLQLTRYWHVYRAEAMEALQQRLEYAEVRDNQDYNGDGHIGRMVKVSRLAPDIIQERQFVQDVTAFVTAALTSGTGERALLGLALPGGRKLEQAQYDSLRDLLIAQRYAYWRSAKNHRNGWYFRPDLGAAEIISGVLGT